MICSPRSALRSFRIHVNNRKILNGVLEANGLSDNAVSLLRSLDKLPKIGRDKVIEEMVNGGAVTSKQAETLLDLGRDARGQPGHPCPQSRNATVTAH